MNASKNRARGALIFASIMLASLVFGLSTGGSQMAGAASPASTASAPSAPNETWQNPVNVSNAQGVYDNDPAVGGSALNDGATVAEESRDEGTQHAFGRIVNHSNSVLGLANFLGARNLEESGWKQNGSPRVAHDGLGRRHVIWWQADSNGTCGWYARVDADGVARSIQ
ncbi:MAG: hypothetical protein ACJ78Q_02740, partial [Chloroflexia bacterium]